MAHAPATCSLQTEEFPTAQKSLLFLVTKSQENHYILMLAYRYSKPVPAITTSVTDAKFMEILLIVQWIVPCGVPTYLVTDNGVLLYLSSSHPFATIMELNSSQRQRIIHKPTAMPCGFTKQLQRASSITYQRINETGTYSYNRFLTHTTPKCTTRPAFRRIDSYSHDNLQAHCSWASQQARC